VSRLKPCPLCDNEGPWATPTERSAHIRAHHTADCEVCGASVNASGLDAHMRVLHPDGPAAPDVEQLLDAGGDGPGDDTPLTSTDAAFPTSDEGETPESMSGNMPAVDEPAAPEADEPAAANELVCPECGAGPFADRRGIGVHRVSHREVTCDECGKTVKATGLGAHKRSHRPGPKAAAPPAPRGDPNHASMADGLERRLARGLADVVAELLPGAAPDLLDRLASFVAKHQPDPGHARWVAATLTAGPWLCRSAGIGMIVAREHVPVIVVSLDDVYAHLGRQHPDTASAFHAGQSWPHPRAAS